MKTSKILTMILALAMVLTLLAPGIPTALAEEDDGWIEVEFNYSKDDGYYLDVGRYGAVDKVIVKMNKATSVAGSLLGDWGWQTNKTDFNQQATDTYEIDATKPIYHSVKVYLWWLEDETAEVESIRIHVVEGLKKPVKPIIRIVPEGYEAVDIPEGATSVTISVKDLQNYIDSIIFYATSGKQCAYTVVVDGQWGEGVQIDGSFNGSDHALINMPWNPEDKVEIYIWWPDGSTVDEVYVHQNPDAPRPEAPVAPEDAEISYTGTGVFHDVGSDDNGNSWDHYTAYVNWMENGDITYIKFVLNQVLTGVVNGQIIVDDNWGNTVQYEFTNVENTDTFEVYLDGQVATDHINIQVWWPNDVEVTEVYAGVVESEAPAEGETAEEATEDTTEEVTEEATEEAAEETTEEVTEEATEETAEEVTEETTEETTAETAEEVTEEATEETTEEVTEETTEEVTEG